MLKPEAKRLANECEVALSVIDLLRKIRTDTGHGRIELVVKDGLVVYLQATVRTNL